MHCWCVLPPCSYCLHQAPLTFGSWFSRSKSQGSRVGRGGRLFERTGILLGVGDTPRRRGSFLVWKVVMTATIEMGKKAGPGIKGQPAWGIGAVLTPLLLPPSLKCLRPGDRAPARPALLGATSRHPEPILSPQDPELPLLLKNLQDPRATPSPEPLRVSPSSSLFP